MNPRDGNWFVPPSVSFFLDNDKTYILDSSGNFREK